MYLASQCGHTEIAKFFIEKEIFDLSFKNSNGDTVLMIGQKRKEKVIVLILLIKAASYGRDQIVTELLKKDKDKKLIQDKDKKNWTTLMIGN